MCSTFDSVLEGGSHLAHGPALVTRVFQECEFGLHRVGGGEKREREREKEREREEEMGNSLGREARL